MTTIIAQQYLSEFGAKDKDTKMLKKSVSLKKARTLTAAEETTHKPPDSFQKSIRYTIPLPVIEEPVECLPTENLIGSKAKVRINVRSVSGSKRKFKKSNNPQSPATISTMSSKSPIVGSLNNFSAQVEIFIKDFKTQENKNAQNVKPVTRSMKLIRPNKRTEFEEEDISEADLKSFFYSPRNDEIQVAERFMPETANRLRSQFPRNKKTRALTLKSLSPKPDERKPNDIRRSNQRAQTFIPSVALTNSAAAEKSAHCDFSQIKDIKLDRKRKSKTDLKWRWKGVHEKINLINAWYNS